MAEMRKEHLTSNPGYRTYVPDPVERFSFCGVLTSGIERSNNVASDLVGVTALVMCLVRNLLP